MSWVSYVKVILVRVPGCFNILEGKGMLKGDKHEILLKIRGLTASRSSRNIRNTTRTSLRVSGTELTVNSIGPKFNLGTKFIKKENSKKSIEY